MNELELNKPELEGNRMNRFLIIVLIAGLIISGTISLAPAAQDPASAKTSAGVDAPSFDTLRQEGFQSLYNLDYTTAREKFERMIEVAPDHPAGYLYLATNLWMNVLNSSRRLQTGIYSGTSFYAETKEKVDPTVDKNFRDYVARAISLAEAKLAKDNDNIEATYYLGAAYAALGGYEASVARSFFSALRGGSKAVDLHKRVIKLDPNYIDAYLTIGMYDYIVGSLPLPVKILAAIGGIRGSRRRGIEELKQVVERGKLASDDARVMLIALYNREKKFEDALKLLTELSSKYPRNYLLKLESAATLFNLNRRDESYRAFEELLKSDAGKDAPDLIHYQYGEVLFNSREYKPAIDQFRAVTKLLRADHGLVSIAHLRIGQSYDMTENRKQALAQYRLVLSRENVYDSHDLAKKYLKKPYAPEEAKTDGEETAAS